MAVLDSRKEDSMFDNTIKFSFSKLFGAAVLCSALIGAASAAQAYAGEELAKDAKVSLADARTIALKAHPGKITDEELEKESGGSGLRYVSTSRMEQRPTRLASMLKPERFSKILPKVKIRTNHHCLHYRADMFCCN
jgi:hypothetical protein